MGLVEGKTFVGFHILSTQPFVSAEISPLRIFWFVDLGPHLVVLRASDCDLWDYSWQGSKGPYGTPDSASDLAACKRSA